MSIYHRDKCTKEEATKFKGKVKAFLDTEKLAYHKIQRLS